MPASIRQDTGNNMIITGNVLSGVLNFALTEGSKILTRKYLKTTRNVEVAIASGVALGVTAIVKREDRVGAILGGAASIFKDFATDKIVRRIEAKEYNLLENKITVNNLSIIEDYTALMVSINDKKYFVELPKNEIFFVKVNSDYKLPLSKILYGEGEVDVSFDNLMTILDFLTSRKAINVIVETDSIADPKYARLTEYLDLKKIPYQVLEGMLV